jgi:hypothetical protein
MDSKVKNICGIYTTPDHGHYILSGGNAPLRVCKGYANRVYLFLIFLGWRASAKIIHYLNRRVRTRNRRERSSLLTIPDYYAVAVDGEARLILPVINRFTLIRLYIYRHVIRIG